MANKPKSSARKEAQRKRKKERKRQAKLDQITRPDHISSYDYSGKEWKELCERPEFKSEYMQRARGTCYGLLVDQDETSRTKTFASFTQDQFITEIDSIATDKQMRPIEQKFKEKFGVFKYKSYEKWASEVHGYWNTENSWDPDFKLLERCVNELIVEFKAAIKENEDLFPQGRMIPLTVEESYEKVTKGKNSGWPFFSKKWNNRTVMREFYIEEAKRLIKGEPRLTENEMFPDGNVWYILFKRVQVKGSDCKIRPVLCPPKFEAIAGKCITDKFIDLFKRIPQFAGFNGGENLHNHLGGMMENDYLIEGDFSKFDQKSKFLIPVIMEEIISKLLPEEYKPFLREITKSYTNVRLITPEGVLYSESEQSGLPSGGSFTSIIGTIANALCVKYAMKKMKIESFKAYSFGDDLALGTNEEFNGEAFDAAMRELNMDCNKAKQEITKGESARFSFLGYYYFKSDWKKGIRGKLLAKFPIWRAAVGLFSVERPILISDLNLPKEQINKLLEQDKDLLLDQLDAVAMIMRLSVCQGNRDFLKLCEFVFKNGEHITLENVLPYEKTVTAFRSNRRSKRIGLFASGAVQALYTYKEKPIDYNLVVDFIEKCEENAMEDIFPLIEIPEKMQGTYYHSNTSSSSSLFLRSNTYLGSGIESTTAEETSKTVLDDDSIRSKALYVNREKSKQDFAYSALNLNICILQYKAIVIFMMMLAMAMSSIGGDG